MKISIPQKKSNIHGSKEKSTMLDNKIVFLVKGISGRPAIFGSMVSAFTKGPLVVSDGSIDFDEFEITGVSHTSPGAADDPPDRVRLTVHYRYAVGDDAYNAGTIFIEQMEIIE